MFSLGKGKKWTIEHSPLYLDFLAGNQEFLCTPWGMPTRNVFGWQKPCYLVGEGYVSSFKELMETTDWDSYGTGRYEKCANCMAHCGYEPTAADAAVRNPIKTALVAVFGPRTTGPMAPEISLSQQRPAEYVHKKHVDNMLANLESQTRDAPARPPGRPCGGVKRPFSGPQAAFSSAGPRLRSQL